MAASGTTPTATSTSVTRFMRRTSIFASRSSAIAVELMSIGDAGDEDEDSTMPMKALPTLMGFTGAAAGAALGGVAAVVVGRGFTVERTEVSTVVRSIFDVESVVCEIWVRGVASQLAVLLQKMIRLF